MLVLIHHSQVLPETGHLPVKIELAPIEAAEVQWDFQESCGISNRLRGGIDHIAGASVHYIGARSGGLSIGTSEGRACANSSDSCGRGGSGCRGRRGGAVWVVDRTRGGRVDIDLPHATKREVIEQLQEIETVLVFIPESQLTDDRGNVDLLRTEIHFRHQVLDDGDVLRRA